MCLFLSKLKKKDVKYPNGTNIIILTTTSQLLATVLMMRFLENIANGKMYINIKQLCSEDEGKCEGFRRDPHNCAELAAVARNHVDAANCGATS